MSLTVSAAAARTDGQNYALFIYFSFSRHVLVLKRAFVVVFFPAETHVLAQPTLQPAESSPFLLQQVVFSPDAPKVCPLSPLNASFYDEH